MSTDTTYLRYIATGKPSKDKLRNTLIDAADTIDAKDAEIARLREALKLADSAAPTADGQAHQVDRSPEMQGSQVDVSGNLQGQARQDADKVDAVPYRVVSDIAHRMLDTEKYERFMDAIDAARAQQGSQP